MKLKVVSVSEELVELAAKLGKENASDADVAHLRVLAEKVRQLEGKPSTQLAFVYGWQASINAEDKDLKSANQAYRDWILLLDQIEMNAQVVSDNPAMYDVRAYPNGPPGGPFPNIKVSKELAEGFGSLGHIDLFDPDTGDRMNDVPVTDGPKPQARAFAPGQTADMVLMDRVAKLETEVVKMKRDMGERIKDLSRGTAT